MTRDELQKKVHSIVLRIWIASVSMTAIEFTDKQIKNELRDYEDMLMELSDQYVKGGKKDKK